MSRFMSLVDIYWKSSQATAIFGRRFDFPCCQVAAWAWRVLIPKVAEGQT